MPLFGFMGLGAVSLEDRGAVADWDGTTGTDNRAALVAAIDEVKTLGGTLYIPAGRYWVDNSSLGAVELPNGIRIFGDGGLGDGKGSRLTFNGPAFKSDLSKYLSDFQMGYLSLEGSDFNLVTAGNSNNNHCFELASPVNGTRFEKLNITRFGGDGFRITRQTDFPSDPTGIGNTVFDQIFTLSCGKYAYDVAGEIVATWNMPNINACVGGAFNLHDSTEGNRGCATIISLWWEGQRSWTSRNPVRLADNTNANILFLGCVFAGPINGQNVVTVVSEGADVTFIQCASWLYDNWLVGHGSLVGSNRVNFYSNKTLQTEFLLVPGTVIRFPGVITLTSDPNDAGRLWNDAGTLKISAG